MAMAVSGVGAGIDGSQMLGGLGELSGAASQISGNLSPSGKLVDLAAGVLQLPAPVKDLAKILVGAFLMDIPAIISGATGLFSQAMEAARTECPPPDQATTPGGYAPASPGLSSTDSALDRISSKLSATQKEHDDLLNRMSSGKELDQKDQFRLQQLQQKLERMNTLLSSILKHEHQMAMVVIQNLGR